MFTQTDCHIYKVSEFEIVANLIRGDMKTVKTRKVWYYDIPWAFDIEDTSFYARVDTVGSIFECSFVLVISYYHFFFFFIVFISLLIIFSIMSISYTLYICQSVCVNMTLSLEVEGI